MLFHQSLFDPPSRRPAEKCAPPMSGAATGGARTPTPKRQQPAPLTADELTALIVDTCMALLICGGLVLCLVAVFVP